MQLDMNEAWRSTSDIKATKTNVAYGYEVMFYVIFQWFCDTHFDGFRVFGEGGIHPF